MKLSFLFVYFWSFGNDKWLTTHGILRLTFSSRSGARETILFNVASDGAKYILFWFLFFKFFKLNVCSFNKNSFAIYRVHRGKNNENTCINCQLGVEEDLTGLTCTNKRSREITKGKIEKTQVDYFREHIFHFDNVSQTENRDYNKKNGKKLQRFFLTFKCQYQLNYGR